MVDVGDRVQVASTKVGQTPRDGVVIGVSGPLVRVRWSSGEESTVVPTVGSMTVIGGVKAPSGRNRRGQGAQTASNVAAPAKKVKTTKSTTKAAAKAPKPTKSTTEPSKATGSRKSAR